MDQPTGVDGHSRAPNVAIIALKVQRDQEGRRPSIPLRAGDNTGLWAALNQTCAPWRAPWLTRSGSAPASPLDILSLTGLTIKALAAPYAIAARAPVGAALQRSGSPLRRGCGSQPAMDHPANSRKTAPIASVPWLGHAVR